MPECRPARGQTSYCTRHSAESNAFIRLQSDETLLTQEIDDETTDFVTIEYVHIDDETMNFLIVEYIHTIFDGYFHT